MKPKVIIATPVRAANTDTAVISVGYHNFVYDLMLNMGAEHLDGAITFSCDVVRGRNRLAAKVLREKPDCTHVLWVDDDQWADNWRIVPWMIGTGEDLIGAPYTNKKPPLRWVHQAWSDSPSIPDERGVVDVMGLGFGFTLTSRRCLEKLTNVAEHYQDTPNPHMVGNIFGQLYDQPDPQAPQVLLSEDYSFCKRWRDLGGKVKLLPAGVIYHSGAYPWSAKDIVGALPEKIPDLIK